MAKPKRVTRQVVEARERWTKIIRQWRKSGLGVRAFCQKHGVNTFTYIRDMLVRVSTEPASRVRELLPDRWKAVSVCSVCSVVRIDVPCWRYRTLT